MTTVPKTALPSAPAADRQAALESSLLDRARQLAPVFAARAAAAEKHRRIPDETHRDFLDAGFYRVLQPAVFGGLELSYGIHFELAAEIARACPSSAWVLGVMAAHAWILGMFPAEAQREFWAEPDNIVASSFFPAGGSAARENGGFRVQGRWKFSSGVDHAQGAILMAFPAASGGGSPSPYFLLVPRQDYQIEDTWHASGLIATGSNDIVIDGAFVPGHRAVEVALTATGKSPGGAFHPGPLYRLPLFAVFGYTLVGTALGGAQGALDFMAGLIKGRPAAGPSNAPASKQREQESAQMRIAEAAAQINAAGALLRQDRARINQQASTGEFPGQDGRVTYRLNLGYATRLCVGAMETLYGLTGAQGLAMDNPVQRAWRDVHAVSLHVGLRWDIQAINYGAVRLGLPCPDPRL